MIAVRPTREGQTDAEPDPADIRSRLGRRSIVLVGMMGAGKSSVGRRLAARLGMGLPAYSVDDTGPDHSKVFTATVLLDGKPIATGEGSSKKQAEMGAALEAWTVLQQGRRH